MAKLSFTQKTYRMVSFLMGLRSPRAFGAMKRFGMTKKDLDEGWQLLNDCGQVRGDRDSGPETVEPKLLDKIDAWENAYFPVADATLRRNFPEVHKRVFLNLSQTSGPPVVLGVKLFVDRIIGLEKSNDKPSKDARALLIERGLTKSVVDEAIALLAEAGTPLDDSGASALEDYAAEIRAAEEAMWAWYLEWAQIARVAIKDGRILLSLFPNRRVANAPDAEEDEAPAEPEVAGPIGQAATD